MNKLFLTIVVAFFAVAVSAADQWVEGSDGKVTGFTIYGGSENGKNLFLCAGEKAGTYHPGKIVGKSCNFGYAGEEVTVSKYYTLQVSKKTLPNYKWFKASNGVLPKQKGFVPIEVGQEGNQILYVCRANHKKGVHPGKIVGKNCNFGWGGKEVFVPNYEVLMFNGK